MTNNVDLRALKPGDIVPTDTLMCTDYNVPIGYRDASGTMHYETCPECNIHHDMQSTFIVKAGNPLPDRPHRILLVDDDIDVRESIAKALKMYGFEVYQESHGDSAFERWRESYPFEFVLTDFQFFPGRRVSSCGCAINHGADLVREIRKLVPSQRMAIMSGDARTARGALDASVQDVPVLEKPVRTKQIIELFAKA